MRWETLGLGSSTSLTNDIRLMILCVLTRNLHICVILLIILIVIILIVLDGVTPICGISTQILIQAVQRIRTEPSHECCVWAEELALPLERVASSWHYVQSQLIVGWNNKRRVYLTGLIGVAFIGGVTISTLTVMNRKHKGKDNKRLTTHLQRAQ